MNLKDINDFIVKYEFCFQVQPAEELTILPVGSIVFYTDNYRTIKWGSYASNMSIGKILSKNDYVIKVQTSKLYFLNFRIGSRFCSFDEFPKPRYGVLHTPENVISQINQYAYKNNLSLGLV